MSKQFYQVSEQAENHVVKLVPFLTQTAAKQFCANLPKEAFKIKKVIVTDEKFSIIKNHIQNRDKE